MTQFKSITKTILITLLATGTVVLIVFLSNRGGGNGEPKGTYHSPTLFAMDTALDITIQGRSTVQEKADADAAVKLARDIEAHTSRFIATSDVSGVNAGAGVAPVKVHEDTMYLVQKSLEYGAITGGAFDITIAPIVELWGFYNQVYKIPSQEEINRALAFVDYRKVVVDRAGGTVFLPEKGMQIDMGGVAKGYAVNQMYELLKNRGVKSALVNFGGSVGALGRRADGKQWVIGIKHPRAEGGDLIGELHVENAFVNSSGDYERYFVRNGTRYCHIFDPATGYQPRSVISTTLVGPDATVADILCKVPFVIGPQKGLEFMKGEPGFQALIVGETGKTYFTPNMKSEYVITIQEQI